MLSLLRRVFATSPTAGAAKPPSPQRVDEPGRPLAVHGGNTVDLTQAMDYHEGLPHVDWRAVRATLADLPAAEFAPLWVACQRAWLCCLRDALGGDYKLYETAGTFVLGAFVDGTAVATARYVDSIRGRVLRVLEEIAQVDPAGRQILLVFAEQDDYYHYVSYFHPEEGEFPMSAGMHVNAGCPHFMLHGEELDHFEPTIVHEMTHGLLTHLPIPAWLNEGMAVNSEQRLTRRGADIWSVLELEEKHRGFWNEQTIQEFWSGAAYVRTDEGNELAYDLGRILVNGMSSEWAAFKRFAAAANLADGGDAAAREHMHVDLGEYVRHFLAAAPGDWGPRPASWPQDPERGGF